MNHDDPQLVVRGLIEKGKVYKPNGKKSRDKPKVVFRHAHEIVAEKREIKWLLYKVIEAMVLAVLAGARGTYKSFIVLDWCMRVAMSESRPGQRRTVVILSGEGAGLDRRIDAWMKTHAPDTDLSTLSVLVLERPLNLSLEVDMAALTEAISGLRQPPAMVAIDTFSKFAAGIEENDNTEVAGYLSLLSSTIRDAFRTTVVLVAHTGHTELARPRGASALMANPDAEYIVQRNPSEMTVTVTRERFKDGSALPPLAYKASVVDLLRIDAYGDPVTSLALHSTDVPPIKSKQPGKNQEKAIVALKEWARSNPDAGNITSIDITAIFTTQAINSKRRREVLDYLIRMHVLKWSVGGYTIDRAML